MINTANRVSSGVQNTTHENRNLSQQEIESLIKERDYYKEKSNRLQNKVLDLQSQYLNEFRKEFRGVHLMIAV